MFPFAFEQLPVFLLFMVTFTKKADCNWKLELDCELIKFVFYVLPPNRKQICGEYCFCYTDAGGHCDQWGNASQPLECLNFMSKSVNYFQKQKNDFVLFVTNVWLSCLLANQIPFIPCNRDTPAINWSTAVAALRGHYTSFMHGDQFASHGQELWGCFKAFLVWKMWSCIMGSVVSCVFAFDCFYLSIFC